MMRPFCTAVLLNLLLASSAPAQSSPGAALPAGDGRELLAAACSSCHGLNTIMAMRDGEAGWRLFVYDMILRGAQLNQGEADTVVKYLVRNFGPGAPAPARTAGPAIAATLPSGPGRDVVESRCTACHGIDRVVTVRRTAADWNAIIKNMSARGAALSAEQTQQIARYLTEHFGR